MGCLCECLPWVVSPGTLVLYFLESLTDEKRLLLLDSGTYLLCPSPTSVSGGRRHPSEGRVEDPGTAG